MNSYAFGFSDRKLIFLSNFLRAQCGLDTKIRPLLNSQDMPDHGTLYVWGMATPPVLKQPHKIIRVEDGFLRSAGLGAALARPLSWVFDDQGLYFDASRPSQLEKILNMTVLNQDSQGAAARLRSRIISTGVSKYNLSRSIAPSFPQDRRVVLVAGQVEDDASIHWGADKVRTNLGLLKAVRADEPDAYIIYKPHPDVVTGLRAKGLHEEEAHAIASHVLTEGDIIALLPHIDAIHTMTSLSGFEAIIRGVQVVCWGRPFYAGWGLTTDRCVFPRRTRSLNINELVHGALIAYPTYLSPDGSPSSAADTVETLAKLRASKTQSGLGPVGRTILSVALKLRSKQTRSF